MAAGSRQFRYGVVETVSIKTVAKLHPIAAIGVTQDGHGRPNRIKRN
jgi:hypothetical protein